MGLSPGRMSEKLRPGAQGLACLTCNINGLKSLTVLASWPCGMLEFRSPFACPPQSSSLDFLEASSNMQEFLECSRSKLQSWLFVRSM